MRNRFGWICGAIAVAILAVVLKVMLEKIQPWSDVWWVLVIVAIVLLVTAFFLNKPYKSKADEEIERIGNQARKSVERQFKEIRKQKRDSKK